MRAVGAFLVLFESEQDSVWVISLTFGQLGVFVPPVVELALSITTTRLGLNMRLHGLLAVLLLLCHSFVSLVARQKLLTHFLSIGKLATL